MQATTGQPRLFFPTIVRLDVLYPTSSYHHRDRFDWVQSSFLNIFFATKLKRLLPNPQPHSKNSFWIICKPVAKLLASPYSCYCPCPLVAIPGSCHPKRCPSPQIIGWRVACVSFMWCPTTPRDTTAFMVHCPKRYEAWLQLLGQHTKPTEKNEENQRQILSLDTKPLDKVLLSSSL